MAKAVSVDPILSTLSRCFLFQGIHPDFIEVMLAHPDIELRDFSPSEVILDAHSAVDRLGIVLTGQAQVYKLGAGGRRVRMSMHGPGGCFGVATLFHPVEYYVSQIVAREACRVLFLPERLLEEMMRQEFVLVRNYIAYLADRICYLNSRIEGFTGVDTTHKLALWLAGQPEGEIALDRGMAALSQQMGVSRASLYRAMQALQERGVLHRAGKSICIADRQALQALARKA